MKTSMVMSVAIRTNIVCVCMPLAKATSVHESQLSSSSMVLGDCVRHQTGARMMRRWMRLMVMSVVWNRVTKPRSMRQAVGMTLIIA